MKAFSGEHFSQICQLELEISFLIRTKSPFLEKSVSGGYFAHESILPLMFSDPLTLTATKH